MDLKRINDWTGMIIGNGRGIQSLDFVSRQDNNHLNMTCTCRSVADPKAVQGKTAATFFSDGFNGGVCVPGAWHCTGDCWTEG